MLRSIGAGVAGMLVASLIVFAIEFSNSLLYPFPPGFDMNDQAQIAAFIQTMPAGAFVAVWVGWTIGAFVGTWVARRLTPGGSNRPAIAVAALFFLFCILNMLMVPHPPVFVVASILSVALASALALKQPQPAAA